MQSSPEISVTTHKHTHVFHDDFFTSFDIFVLFCPIAVHEIQQTLLYKPTGVSSLNDTNC
jgi:hypothetical protein